MTNLLEQSRAYISANGGHSTVAPTIGVTAANSSEICAGKRPVSAQFALGMAALIGCTPAVLLRENSDLQLLTRRGAIS